MLVSTRGLTKRYGRRLGLDGVDLDVDEGTIFGFLGPNGAGKTTTIRLLLGFLKPTAGRGTIFGLDCWGASHRIKRDVGYVAGDLRLYSWMTGANGLSIVGGVRGADLRGPGMALLERFSLDPAVPVRKMSRGMRQKLGLVLALAPDPRLLVLDEPTSGLDPLMQEELARCLRERAAAGRTVFFSSHTLSEVEQLCDRVAIVRAGQVVANESIESLRREAMRAVTIRFETDRAALELAPPEFLAVHDRHGGTWEADLRGRSQSLVRWAAAQAGVVDVTIGPPDLETLFRRYYRPDGARP